VFVLNLFRMRILNNSVNLPCIFLDIINIIIIIIIIVVILIIIIIIIIIIFIIIIVYNILLAKILRQQFALKGLRRQNSSLKYQIFAD